MLRGVEAALHRLASAWGDSYAGPHRGCVLRMAPYLFPLKSLALSTAEDQLHPALTFIYGLSHLAPS